jgi:crotonobetainyl-CoA:carnitine CoA-transferase CaiB-like acyl-CoA transferase
MERHLPTVCRALGRPDLPDDPRFADAPSIRRNCAEMISLFDDIIAKRTLAEWSEVFEREGVWWAPVRTPAEVITDPQFLANEGLVDVGHHPDGQRSIGGPVIFSGVSQHPGRAPALGEHTAEVLEELSRRADSQGNA